MFGIQRCCCCSDDNHGIFRFSNHSAIVFICSHFYEDTAQNVNRWMNNEKNNNNEKETLTIIIHSLVGVGYFCEKKNFIVSSITNENETENYHVHCAHIASTRENQQSQIEIRRNFSTNIMWLEHIFCSAVNLMLEKWFFFLIRCDCSSCSLYSRYTCVDCVLHDK